ncbi:MAG: hypothetical protein MJ204_09615 [Bacteroidales bacterium]|nr:hypothetical protein [Bacteroidales bacterium]
MKKIIVTCLALISLAIVGNAQENVSIRIPEGYQGFVEQENRFHFWGAEDNSVAVSTTHGFYFNGHTFVGIGLGVTGSGNYGLVPFYTSVKHVFLNDRTISPSLNARLGSYIGADMGSYGDLAFGVRFASKKDFALTISAALSYYEPFDDVTTEWNVDTDTYKEITKKIDFSGASLRFGIEW